MEYIIPIITVCVTLLLGILGFIVNSLIQRKSNSIQVITKTRLARREKSKTLLSNIIKLSDPIYLDISKDKDDTLKELIGNVTDLRFEYTQTFKCDYDLISASEEVKKFAIEYVKDKNNLEELNNKRNNLIKIGDIYLQTEWKRIKLETVGKMKNKKLSSWDDIYQEYEKNYHD